jgi:hypothetical protein
MNCSACVVTENYLGYFCLLYNSIEKNWNDLLNNPFYVITTSPWMSQNAENLLRKLCPKVELIWVDLDFYEKFNKRLPHYLRFEIHRSLSNYDKCLCFGADQIVLKPSNELFTISDTNPCFCFDDRNNFIGGSEVFPKPYLTLDYFNQLMEADPCNTQDMGCHRKVFLDKKNYIPLNYKYNVLAHTETLSEMIRLDRRIIHLVYKFNNIKLNHSSVIEYIKQFDVSNRLTNIDQKFLTSTWW